MGQGVVGVTSNRGTLKDDWAKPATRRKICILSTEVLFETHCSRDIDAGIHSRLHKYKFCGKSCGTLIQVYSDRGSSLLSTTGDPARVLSRSKGRESSYHRCKNASEGFAQLIC